MKENNNFIQESSIFSPDESPKFAVITNTFDYYQLPQNLKSFFQFFMFFIDGNDDYYFLRRTFIMFKVYSKVCW